MSAVDRDADDGIAAVGLDAVARLDPSNLHRSDYRPSTSAGMVRLLACWAMSTDTARVRGPSAFGGSLRRFAELTLLLAHTDFKLRYFGSALGYFWSLMRPLLFFGVIYFFFTVILHVGKGIPNYGVYLLTGIVLWTFFAEATGNAVSSLVAKETILRKVRFPRIALPLAVTLTSVFNLSLNLIPVILFAVISGVYPQLSWLWMVPIVAGVHHDGAWDRDGPVRPVRSLSRCSADLGDRLADPVLLLADHVRRGVIPQF